MLYGFKAYDITRKRSVKGVGEDTFEVRGVEDDEIKAARVELLEQRLSDLKAHVAEVKRRIPKRAADGESPNKAKYDRYNDQLHRGEADIKETERELKALKGGK